MHTLSGAGDTRKSDLSTDCARVPIGSLVYNIIIISEKRRVFDFLIPSKPIDIIRYYIILYTPNGRQSRRLYTSIQQYIGRVYTRY